MKRKLYRTLFCSCGCGNKIKTVGCRYISGHNSKVSPYIRTPELNIKMGYRLRNNPNHCMNNLEIRRKVSDTKKRLYAEGKLPSQKGKYNPMFGRKLSLEDRIKKSTVAKQLIKKGEIIPFRKGEEHPFYNKKFSYSHVNKILKSNSVSPNKWEKNLYDIINNLFPNEYKLNTKGEILILGRKKPDIVNINGKKKVIELFGEHWHTKVDPKTRVGYFRKLGWDTLIIWGNELKFNNKSRLESKILNFHMR